MNQRIIAFVQGVDNYCAGPPDGFPNRFAVLTWFVDDDSMIDPWSLMRSAVPRIASLVGSDSVIAEYWRQRKKGIIPPKWNETKTAELPWAQLMERSDEALLEEEFPSRFLFLCGGKVVLQAESEMWSLIGGPLPYSDSVTISFFTAEPMHLALRSIFVVEASDLGITISSQQEIE